ncbi:hypothetical protein CF651_19725 [Paenibacillus rigui]|uniref:Uncharacterized protein n=2 Tax=Paenibacillus rigui TaxID=554312 RepID=A0A229UMR7_9BACL|nr:hypothetical protein CF651_19725 [Paenibacillus rigui]
MLTISLMLLLSGCGKNIPAMDPALLQSKLSVLLISKPNLPENTRTTFAKTLLSWRDNEKISYEWIPDVSTLQEQHINKIKSTAYDYIIVVGSELTVQAQPYAAQIPDKKWVLLDDSISGTNTPVLQDKQTLWKQTGANFMQQQWDDWVRQEQNQGKIIEWVTTNNRAIPSTWAPSEEAEYISYSDADGWYAPFQTLVRQHGPNWIAIYSPVDATLLQRMKNLQVPIMNMSTTAIALNWDVVFAGLLDQMKKQQWTPGLQNYTTQEIQVKKP